MARVDLLEELRSRTKEGFRPLPLERNRSRRSSVRLDGIERVLDALIPEGGTAERVADG